VSASPLSHRVYLRFGENEGVGVAHTIGVDAMELVVKQVVS